MRCESVRKSTDTSVYTYQWHYVAHRTGVRQQCLLTRQAHTNSFVSDALLSVLDGLSSPEKNAAEEQAKLASTSMQQVNAGQSDLKAQLEQAQGALAQAGSASANLERKQSEWEVEKQVYQKREMVWEQREHDYKVRLEEQEKQWRAKVEAALQDMSAHPALASLQRENERLHQEVSALQAQLSSMQMLNGGTDGSGGGAGNRDNSNAAHRSMIGKMAARQAGT